MKQLFHITNSRAEGEQQILSMEFGEKHAGFAVTNKPGDYLYELAYCSSEEWNTNLLADFFSAYPCLQQPFYRVKIAYSYTQNILIPSASYKPGESETVMKTMYGPIAGKNIVSELLPEWQLYNTYCVGKEIQEWLKNKFPLANYHHQYSVVIKSVGASAGGGTLIIDFRTEDFTVLVVKNSRLLLAKTFEYITPEDVLYNLLKTCQQLSLSQRELQLLLSGLIDKQSSLYKELYQYFINIEFREANWNTGNELPAHFFTSLNDLARCAS